jgi:hypothetical protein
MREGWQRKSHARRVVSKRGAWFPSEARGFLARRVVSKRGAWIEAYSPASKQKNKAKHEL